MESRQGVGCWKEIAGGAREGGAEVSVGGGQETDRREPKDSPLQCAFLR